MTKCIDCTEFWLYLYISTKQLYDVDCICEFRENQETGIAWLVFKQLLQDVIYK